MSEDFETPTPPAEETQKKNNTVLITVIVVLVLLCCCCVATSALWSLWTFGDQIFGLTLQTLNMLV